MEKTSTTVSYRKEALRAAKDLGYGKAVYERIKDAKDDVEITNIMKTARKNKFKMDTVF